MQTLFEDKIIKELSNYANNINKKVYVVGGVVRDILLNRKAVGGKDIDLTGNLTWEEIKSFLTAQEIQFEVKNRKLEVLSFVVNENSYEYARLRKEQYLKKDTHTPSEVQFVDEVEEDAKRRDFTVNSVYYDRHSNSLLDPVGGVEDIKSKIIKPVLGEDTFKVDPARIIRFIELAVRHNLKFSKDVGSWVKKYATNIKNLTAGRVNKELKRLFMIGKYYDEKTSYIDRVRDMINKLNLQDILKFDI